MRSQAQRKRERKRCGRGSGVSRRNSRGRRAPPQGRFGFKSKSETALPYLGVPVLGESFGSFGSFGIHFQFFQSQVCFSGDPVFFRRLVFFAGDFGRAARSRLVAAVVAFQLLFVVVLVEARAEVAPQTPVTELPPITLDSDAMDSLVVSVGCQALLLCSCLRGIVDDDDDDDVVVGDEYGIEEEVLVVAVVFIAFVDLCALVGIVVALLQVEGVLSFVLLVLLRVGDNTVLVVEVVMYGARRAGSASAFTPVDSALVLRCSALHCLTPPPSPSSHPSHPCSGRRSASSRPASLEPSRASRSPPLGELLPPRFP